MYHNWYQKPIHTWFSLVWGSFCTVIAEKQHFWQFWAPKKWRFRVLGAYYFYIIARKRHPSIIIDIRNLFIYGFHQFGGVSGPLLLKNSILGHFGPPKRGFRVLGAYYFNIIARKRHPSIIIDIRNLFIYGFNQFRGVSGRLLLKNSILCHFGPPKRSFRSPRALIILISLHGKDTQVS